LFCFLGGIWIHAGAGCGSSEQPSKCAGVTCSDHGRCALQVGEPICLCDDGFEPVGLECRAPDLLEDGEACGQDAECASGLCVGAFVGFEGPFPQCTTGASGEPCDSDADCLEGTCELFVVTEGVGQICTATCLSDADCESGMCNQFAPGQSGICTDGLNGWDCWDNGDCLSGRCISVVTASGVESLCTDGLPGDPCNADADCDNGRCIDVISAAGVQSMCTRGESGDPCGQDSDCLGGVCGPDATCP
jgi:hypothetical protein